MVGKEIVGDIDYGKSSFRHHGEGSDCIVSNGSNSDGNGGKGAVRAGAVGWNCSNQEH